MGKKQNELTVPGQGKALVLFVGWLDCYLLDSGLLSSSLPLLVSSNKDNLREQRREGRKGRNAQRPNGVRKWLKVDSKVDKRKKQEEIEQELSTPGERD